VIIMFRKIKIALLRAIGIHVENRATDSNRPQFVAQPFISPDRPGIDNNNESLGGASELTGGGWQIDWDDDNDPLRRAILGQGPKRPFGK
jgi:hypothetical protein